MLYCIIKPHIELFNIVVVLRPCTNQASRAKGKRIAIKLLAKPRIVKLKKKIERTRRVKDKYRGCALASVRNNVRL